MALTEIARHQYRFTTCPDGQTAVTSTGNPIDFIPADGRSLSAIADAWMDEWAAPPPNPWPFTLHQTQMAWAASDPKTANQPAAA